MRKVFGVPWVVFVVPLIFFLVKLATINDYGISWDEPEHFLRGQAYFHFFRTGEGNYSSLSEKTSYYQADDLTYEWWLKHDAGHPPINGILASATNYIFHHKLGLLGDIQAYHLFTILVSTFGVLVVALFGYLAAGTLAGVTSALIFATYPLFFAESTFNIKDPIETAFFAATIFTFWLGATRESWKWFLAGATFFGLAFGVKFNILFLPAILIPWLVIRFWGDLSKGLKHIAKKLAQVPKSIYLALIFAPLIIIGIFYGSWPFLWQDPINNFLEIAGFYKEKGLSMSYQPGFTVGPFNFYAVTWILITTFPYVLLLTTLGVLSAFKDKGKNKTVLLWVLWLFIPILRVTSASTGIHGGVRQIMEFTPAFSLLAGFGSKRVYEWLVTKKISKSAAVVALLLPFVYHLTTLVRLHPHQNVYFNSLISGLSGAKAKQIPYWGNSFGNAYKPALDWLNENAEPNAKLALIQSTALNVPATMLRPDISRWNQHWSGLGRGGEYLLELTYNNPIRAYPFAWDYVETFLDPVYEVKVDGVTIATLWKNDLAHTKDAFRREEQIVPTTVIVNKDGSITAKLTKPEELTRLTIFFEENEACSKVTGIVETTLDQINWKRELELVPNSQISEKESVSDGKMTYYFVAREAVSVRFVADSTDSCILVLPRVEVWALEK